MKKALFETRLTSMELAQRLLGTWEGVGLTKLKMGAAERPLPKPKDRAEKCVENILGAV
jgi:hypothetical protein